MTFKETEQLELKKSTSELGEALESIVAILNKHGSGKLYFGISNDGKVIGQQIGKDTLRTISQAISNHIAPRIHPDISKVTIQGKDCILVEFNDTERPYYVRGVAYMRDADENNKMSPKVLEKFILAKNRDTDKWESEPSNKALKDVNEDILEITINKAREAGRINFKYSGVEETLNKLGLMEKGKLLKAAEVLFCDKNTLEVQAAVFAGTSKSKFIDMKQFKGNIIALLETSEAYLHEHIDWEIDIGRLERAETSEVPIMALREALVNSFCHRDYRNPKGNEVAVFKDRVEIYNPGDFPEGYTPEDFIAGEERSVLRNPLIAETLYKAKEIEKWGSGIKRIADDCKAAGVKVEFKVLKSGFLVTFYRKSRNDMAPKNAEKALRTTRELPGNYPETTRKILLAILERPEITRKELAQFAGITEDGVKYQLAKLAKDGVLRRVGPGRGGHWEIVE